VVGQGKGNHKKVEKSRSLFDSLELARPKSPALPWSSPTPVPAPSSFAGAPFP
jgi:hypothetical protein